MDTLNAAYKVRETRSLLKQYLVALALTLGIGVLLVVSTLSVIAGDAIVRALALPRSLSFVWRIGEWPLV